MPKVTYNTQILKLDFGVGCGGNIVQKTGFTHIHHKVNLLQLVVSFPRISQEAKKKSFFKNFSILPWSFVKKASIPLII